MKANNKYYMNLINGQNEDPYPEETDFSLDGPFSMEEFKKLFGEKENNK